MFQLIKNVSLSLAIFILASPSSAIQYRGSVDMRAPGSGVAPEGTGGVEPFEEYAKHLKSRRSLSVLGEDMFGDQVNLYTGTLRFSHSDASIPGNSELPVSISRSLEIAARPHYAPNDRPFSDWDLDLPRISGTYGVRTDGTTWSADRCTSPNPPASVPVPGGNLYTALDFWTGLQAELPGGGELMVIDAGSPTPAPSTAPPGGFRWVTSGLTYVSCLPGEASDGGDGFLAMA